MPFEDISLFPNPSAPDLGCFVRRKHGVEIDEEATHNVHVDLNPSIDFNPRFHQCYFRVVCGEAAFFQRCFVYMTSDLNIPPPILEQFPPQFILGGEFTPRPSDWQRFPTQSGQRFYWFFGQHRNPNGGSWTPDALTAHSYDIYDNGTLSTVHYDDTGGDRDLDDLELEVAIVGRRSWIDVIQATEQATINRDREARILDGVRARMEKAAS
jgi:hypothetical protein